MWCPKCKSEFREGITECPTCKVPLVETLEEAEVEAEQPKPVLLVSFQDREELGLATGLLDSAGIPYLLREPGSGEVLRVVTGANMMGTEIYVDPRHLGPARYVLRQMEGEDDEPAGDFDEDALNEAIDEFAAEYPEETEEKSDPANPEGYRIALIFLAIFGGAALLAILFPLLRSLALP